MMKTMCWIFDRSAGNRGSATGGTAIWMSCGGDISLSPFGVAEAGSEARSQAPAIANPNKIAPSIRLRFMVPISISR